MVTSEELHLPHDTVCMYMSTEKAERVQAQGEGDGREQRRRKHRHLLLLFHGLSCTEPPHRLVETEGWTTTNLACISLICFLLLLYGLEGVVGIFLQVGEEFS